MLVKPKIGEPCNNCGLCCQMQICNTGAFLLKKTKSFGEKLIKGPCPAFISNENGFGCGLVISPSKFIKLRNYKEDVISKVVSHLIGAGTGCDEIGYDSYIDPAEEAKLDKMIQTTAMDIAWKEKTIKYFNTLQKIRG